MSANKFENRHEEKILKKTPSVLSSIGEIEKILQKCIFIRRVK